MAPTSRWREYSRRRIDSVLARLPADATDEEKRNAIRAAYPFGPRQYHPYRMWREEARRALGMKVAKTDPDGWVLTPDLYLRFRCRWCDQTIGLPSQCCLQCLPDVERTHELLSDGSKGVALLKACREHPGEELRRLILADWLSDHGRDDLADLFRATVAATH